MRKKQKVVGVGLFVLLILVAIGWYLHGKNFEVLNPAGVIADKERRLMIVASLLSLIVVVPVFVLMITFAYKYRETNEKPQKYRPDSDGNTKLEVLWWGVPTILLAVLGVIIWQSSHELDPYKPIASNVKAINVQAVALDWKWLFIYPDEGVASVNFLPLPVNTPVNFELTSDAPMNSLWIPQLGGQVYAMSGMTTQLHLMATKTGDFNGQSANISGVGFSSMTFKTHVTTEAGYQQWLSGVRSNDSATLDDNSYAQLAKPSQNMAPKSFMLGDENLYNTVVMKYMASDPSEQSEMSSMGMSGMGM